MPKSKPPEVRQLAQLLQTRLIPWLQGGAPLVLLDAPPRSSRPLSVTTRPASALETMVQSLTYPLRQRWSDQHLNSTSVLVLSCVVEGEADYRVHSLPGEEGREWIVPIEQGTFFVVPPNTPFSDGSKVAWERPEPENAFARGVLIHLRRDGVSCHTYTSRKGKLWLHPYIFLYEFEAVALGEKLLAEMRRPGGPAQAVSYLYLQLIFRLLERAIADNAYATLHVPQIEILGGAEALGAPALSSSRLVEAALEFIRQRLSEPELSTSTVAERIGLSERHLNRLFHKELQMSIFESIQKQRDEKACDLLTHGSLSIATVATYCGFRRPGVFSAWFARRHGNTPSVFRQRSPQL